MSTELKTDLKTAMKAAMRAGEKARLLTVRTILSEIKRIEVDERIETDDARILLILDKMTKQRRDSIKQYEAAERNDLADVEKVELAIIQEFLPKQLSETEITAIIDTVIAATGASSVKDMGKVMGQVKPQVQGRADMGAIGAMIKAKLA